MNPEIIQLPDFILADLYKDCLVEFEDSDTPQPQIEAKQDVIKKGILKQDVMKENFVIPSTIEKDEIKKLVAEEDAVKEKIIEQAPPNKARLKFLGENKKHVVILVREEKAAIINENELHFLSKILTACNLNIADTAIVNVNKQEVNYAELKEQFKCEFLLLLGVEPSLIKLPFTIPHFQVQPFSGTTIVYTPQLAGMLTGDPDSRLLKSRLWISLKTAFNL